MWRGLISRVRVFAVLSWQHAAKHCRAAELGHVNLPVKTSFFLSEYHFFELIPVKLSLMLWLAFQKDVIDNTNTRSPGNHHNLLLIQLWFLEKFVTHHNQAIDLNVYDHHKGSIFHYSSANWLSVNHWSLEKRAPRTNLYRLFTLPICFRWSDAIDLLTSDFSDILR